MRTMILTRYFYSFVFTGFWDGQNS